MNPGKKVTATEPKVTSRTKGKWMSSTAAHGQLDRLSGADYLPPPETTFTRSPIVVTNNNDVWAETVPKLEENE